MLDDKSLLELCLTVSGMFEDGTARIDYDALTGNFDGQGISVGVLQWCAGQGSLQTLLQNIGGRMGWDKAQTFFKSDIHHLAVLRPAEAIQFCLDHYIAEGGTHVAPPAAAAWKAFLNTPESIAAQIEMATNGVLCRAKALVQEYCPDYPESTRAHAFFFDLVTQSGGMRNAKGHVNPTNSPETTSAIAFANTQNSAVARMWDVASSDDALAQLLLHYAYQRSILSKAEYIWDALSRRGAIACRVGIVHGMHLDFTSQLD